MLDAKIVGKVIQNYRKDKDKTQEVISGLADIAREHLSLIERGHRRPTLDTFYKISLALNVKPSELMKAIEDQIDGELIE
ncbi:MAG: helix-turn-helix domain-containing protein [Oscillospiraceae bacterium]|nr:helix-turn-helix domain-containing protein [Oscillospiraceae bacterium]